MKPIAEDLVRKAAEVRQRAYAPYSGYTVGAAIEDRDGRIWTGVNVENVSFGATICAERSAVVAMIGDGGREISRIAVVTRDGSPPCGMCLQVLSEFAADGAEVVLMSENGALVVRPLKEFLPFGFASADVRRTEPVG
ncbi:cytidine deaminase [Fimbriimonas ginsengisoli]|uniref:Cytidine deaminase n=1 Tax=Fimbriimonas ginsengisoli Gsoil 348 TaxID=661478 RepID=A0A068NUK8_FIMGI|nr:cytidine deaminase [Fimbriimonas ginsengisoli]AIE86455.1 cytidine deaminase [Fimbriimonas ginsengisoli Gsoil 348]